MQTKKDIEAKGFYSFRADANALGGFLEEPVRRAIPTLAPVSLPAVGGFTTARSEGFTFDNLISCRAAYSRVSGQVHEDGSASILSTAVVEDLNLLEVVRADRVVAQLSIWLPRDGSPLKVSTVGSVFEGLRLGGQRRTPIYSPQLRTKECDPKGEPGTTAEDLQGIGAGQVSNVTESFKNRYNATWAKNRSAWLNGAACSVVDGFEEDSLQSYGHIVEICGFGRIILGELFVTADSAQLVSIRAELGCPVKGKISINCAGGGGRGDN